MINPKLLVFVAAFATCGLLPCAEADADGNFRMNVTISFPHDTFDAISVDDMSNWSPEARKVICQVKLVQVVHAYRTMDNLTESGFTQLCKNFTEVNKCYANADPCSHQLSIVLESMYGRPFDCNIPIFKTVLRLCKLTFEDAMDTRNCYDNGMIRFSGSPEEAACRQKCCHDSSTFNASEPLLCGPGRDILFSQYFFDIYSDVEGDPDFDELTNELFSDVTPGIMIDLLTTAGALRYVYMHEVCAMIDTRRKNIADTRASGPYVSIADGKILNDQPGQ